MEPRDINRLVKPSFVDHILIPTDFTEASITAFAHALALSIQRKTALTIMHLSNDHLSREDWLQFPHVRETLIRWKLLPETSRRSDVFDKLGIKVRKLNIETKRPVNSIIDYLSRHTIDLLVIGLNRNEGLPGWARMARAGKIVRKKKLLTLCVPPGTSGFVSVEDGSTTLRRILLPIAENPNPQFAVDYAARAAEAFGSPDDPVEIKILHVGAEEKLPPLDKPKGPAWFWTTSFRTGSPEHVILEETVSWHADLVVMPTRMSESFLDNLRGSVTQKVLDKVQCPLLAVPAKSLD